MQGRKLRRALFALGGGILVVTALAAPAAAQPTPADRVLDRDTSGPVALTMVRSRLPEIATRNGQTVAQLEEALSDRTSWLDREGRLYFVDPAVPAEHRTSRPEVTTASPTQLASVFELHSKPGSNRVIYLDFDGHTITGTAWNASKGIDPVVVPPYDTDGSPGTFSAAEQAVVQEVWQRVAEGYAPFDVDVTTQDPGYAAVNRSDSADVTYGTRVLVDPSTWYQSGCGCGGVAYVGVYDSTGGSHDYYQPALVFTRGVGNGAKNIAEAASHEAGHNLGLSHDGTSTSGYYAGQGAWAPIMGVGYYRAITQWSKGEYADANNKQDDFVVMGQNGLAVRSADYGQSLATATPIALGQTINGVSAAQNDVDYFTITLPAGTYTITANAAPVGGNLDIKLTLFDSSYTVLGSWDPPSGQLNAGTPTGLGASTTQTLAAGTYYIRVDDTGYGDPLTNCYSTYGSHGAVSLQVVTG